MDGLCTKQSSKDHLVQQTVMGHTPHQLNPYFTILPKIFSAFLLKGLLHGALYGFFGSAAPSARLCGTPSLY